MKNFRWPLEPLSRAFDRRAKEKRKTIPAFAYKATQYIDLLEAETRIYILNLWYKIQIRTTAPF